MARVCKSYGFRNKISNRIINVSLKLHWIPRAAIGLAVIFTLFWFAPHYLSSLMGFLAGLIFMLIMILMVIERIERKINIGKEA